MKPTNIHFREDQRRDMKQIAKAKDTYPAEEYRESVDEHILKNRALLNKGPKLKGK